MLLTRIAPGAILIAGLATLLIAGVVSPLEGLSGFGNPGTLTAAVFYVIAAGLRQTGPLNLLVDPLLRDTNTVHRATARLSAPLMIMSVMRHSSAASRCHEPAGADRPRSLI